MRMAAPLIRDKPIGLGVLSTRQRSFAYDPEVGDRRTNARHRPVTLRRSAPQIRVRRSLLPATRLSERKRRVKQKGLPQSKTLYTPGRPML